MIVYQLVNEYKRFSEVEAIALAGSGASGRKDNYSDIDIPGTDGKVSFKINKGTKSERTI